MVYLFSVSETGKPQQENSSSLSRSCIYRPVYCPIAGSVVLLLSYRRLVGTRSLNWVLIGWARYMSKRFCSFLRRDVICQRLDPENVLPFEGT